MAIPVAIHVNPFYSDVVLVPLAWVALAAALARVLDATIDPFTGWLSDHTHTRWGRRRPWIAVAAPIAAIVFIALFTPPAWLSTKGPAFWFGACLMSFFILNMLYGLPHAALGPELTLDYHERSSLFSWREGFGQVGTLVAAVVPGVRRSLRNRPFVVLFTCYVVASIPGAIPGLLMPYFSRYVLNPPPLPASNAQAWLSVFLALYFLSGLLCLPLWLLVAKRFGKLRAWLASFVMGITGGLALWVVHDVISSNGTPGPLAVIAIVIAGVAFTLFVFHLSRIRPALRMRRAPLPDETIRAHLEEIAGEKGVAPARVLAQES